MLVGLHFYNDIYLRRQKFKLQNNFQRQTNNDFLSGHYICIIIALGYQFTPVRETLLKRLERNETFSSLAWSSRGSFGLQPAADGLDEGDDGLEAGHGGEHGAGGWGRLVCHRGQQHPGAPGLAERRGTRGGEKGGRDPVPHICAVAQAASGYLTLLIPSYQQPQQHQQLSPDLAHEPVLQVLANLSKAPREHEQSKPSSSGKRLARSSRSES